MGREDSEENPGPEPARTLRWKDRGCVTWWGGGGSPGSCRAVGASVPGAAPGLEETGQHLEGGAVQAEDVWLDVHSGP